MHLNTGLCKLEEEDLLKYKWLGGIKEKCNNYDFH